MHFEVPKPTLTYFTGQYTVITFTIPIITCNISEHYIKLGFEPNDVAPTSNSPTLTRRQAVHRLITRSQNLRRYEYNNQTSGIRGMLC